jgi:archaellum component FlaC
VLHGQNQIIYPLSGLRKLLQLMSKMDTRLNSIEKKVTKSVDELDEIKTSIKSLTQKISTVEREVTTLKQQYPEID